MYILAGAYTFNEYLIKSESNDENWKLGVVTFYTVLMTVASFAIIVMSFFWFLGKG